MTRRLLTLVPVVLALLSAVATAGATAAPTAGVTPGGDLVIFDTNAPGTILERHAITGLQPDEQVEGIDVRPLTGALYALGIVRGATDDTGRIYTIDPGTGVATQVGNAPFSTALAPTEYGFDINPFSDRIRVVNRGEDNVRVNADDGTVVSVDPDLTPAGDVDAIAYDQNVAGAPQTTLWGYDSGIDRVVRIGDVDGVGSTSANNGQVTLIGATSGVSTSGVAGMDIPAGGTAFLTATTAAPDTHSLYRVDLGLGTLTKLGDFPEAVDDIARLQLSEFVFDAPGVVVRETAVSATVTVARFGNVAGTQTVAYATSDGTATAADYTPASGVLTFGPGETTKTFSVPIALDGIDEADETVGLTLSSPTGGGALGLPSTATLTILGPGPDTVKPRLLLAAPASRSLRRTLGGLPGRVSTSEASAVVIRLRLGKSTLGSAKLTALGPAVRRFRVKLTARGRKALQRRLKRRRSARLTLSATGTDAARNVGTTSARVTIRR